GHLADIGSLPPEHGDAGNGVPRRAARRLLARSHDAVQLLGHLGVDQIHRALWQLVRSEQGVVGLGYHVDNGVADRSHIELGVVHERLSPLRTPGVISLAIPGNYTRCLMSPADICSRAAPAPAASAPGSHPVS